MEQQDAQRGVCYLRQCTNEVAWRGMAVAGWQGGWAEVGYGHLGPVCCTVALQTHCLAVEVSHRGHQRYPLVGIYVAELAGGS